MNARYASSRVGDSTGLAPSGMASVVTARKAMPLPAGVRETIS